MKTFRKMCREYILLDNSNNLWLLKTRLLNKIQKLMAGYTTDTDVIACAKKISGDHLNFISAPRDSDGIGKCLWYLCVLLISDPDAADGFVCRLTFRQSLTLDSIQSASQLAQLRQRVEEEKWRRGEQSAYLYLSNSFLPLISSLSGPCLLLGAGCVLCQQSLMANFSSFLQIICLRQTFICWPQNRWAALASGWPTAGCQVELVNCPLIQTTSR